MLLIFTFAKIQITHPAGAETNTALDRTERVLSKTERTIIFPICGFLYGGSSNTNEDGIPFNNVFESILEINSVMRIPKITTANTQIVERIDDGIFVLNPPIKIVDIVINIGKRPLQGTKLLVIIAINFSRGESIILAPVTPHALHPNPHTHG